VKSPFSKSIFGGQPWAMILKEKRMKNTRHMMAFMGNVKYVFIFNWPGKNKVSFGSFIKGI
jgi:hypothetical protein